MNTPAHDEKLVEGQVTYTLLKDGQLYVVEHVPARINEETGEDISHRKPSNNCSASFRRNANPPASIKAPVYEFR